MSDAYECVCYCIRNEIRGHEATGGYSKDPDDPGGETKYGIAQRDHPGVDIAELTMDGAVVILRTEYWTYDGLTDNRVAAKLLDLAINMEGTGKCGAANPGLGRAGAIRKGDDAHGNFNLPLQVAREKIRDGGKRWCRFGAAHLPFARHAVGGRIGFGRGAGEHAQQGEMGGGNFRRLVGHTGEIFYFFGHGKIHVGLAGGEPDFAHQHVIQLDGLRGL